MSQKLRTSRLKKGPSKPALYDELPQPKASLTLRERSLIDPSPLPVPPFDFAASTQLEQIASALEGQYGRPRLGNFLDPVAEIFFIQLSARTTGRQYERVYAEFSKRFPTLESITRAPLRSIRQCIAPCGLANKRAEWLRSTAQRLLRDFGPDASSVLKSLSAEDAYSYLKGLPGVGPKSALCVMMYSLNFEVLPVDTHVARVAYRLGLLPGGLKHYQAQALLPPKIPARLRYVFHVGLIELGRQLCKPKAPACDECPLVSLCPWSK